MEFSVLRRLFNGSVHLHRIVFVIVLLFGMALCQNSTADTPTSTTSSTPASSTLSTTASSPSSPTPLSSTTPSTLTPSSSSIPTPTVQPTVNGACDANKTSQCTSYFKKNYIKGNVSTVAGIPCFSHVPSSSACGAAVNTSCGASQTSNDTSKFYGLVCTDAGLLVFWTNSTSTSNCELASHINQTMTVLCGTENNTLNCHNASAGVVFHSSARATLVAPFIAKCTVKPTTPAVPKLLPNPVGPAAITAIVVLICLFIVAVLAGFFFWPKCHIADPAAKLVKKATKPASAGGARPTGAPGSNAAAAARPPQQNSASNAVAYDARNNTATVKIPPTHGPSAA